MKAHLSVGAVFGASSSHGRGRRAPAAQGRELGEDARPEPADLELVLRGAARGLPLLLLGRLLLPSGTLLCFNSLFLSPSLDAVLAAQVLRLPAA